MCFDVLLNEHHLFLDIFVVIIKEKMYITEIPLSFLEICSSKELQGFVKIGEPFKNEFHDRGKICPIFIPLVLEF